MNENTEYTFIQNIIVHSLFILHSLSRIYVLFVQYEYKSSQG